MHVLTQSGSIVQFRCNSLLPKWLLLAVLLACPYLQVSAQKITGTIKDRSTSLPIERASVELLKETPRRPVITNVTDSSGKPVKPNVTDLLGKLSTKNVTDSSGMPLVTKSTDSSVDQIATTNADPFGKPLIITLTAPSGKFTILNLDTGRYQIRVTVSGYTPVNRSVQLNYDVDLGDIELLQTSKNLKEVVVTTRKTPMSATVDRKIYNVEQDILASSGSASDILRNVPSVEVDIEGQVSLRGASDVTILINGRPSAMMGANRGEVLQQLPANSIERIEVITNPSAKFRPDGSSGIINIVLKKNVKLGLNGSVNANAGSHNRYNGGATLNYKNGKFSSFITGNIRQDERNRFGTIYREYLDSSGKVNSTYSEYRRSKSRPLSEFINAGIVFTPDTKNEFGINGTYLHRYQVRLDTIYRSFYGNDGMPTSLFVRTRYAPATDIENNATAYWEHQFSKEGHTLRMEATTSMEKEDERNYYQNAFSFPSLNTTLDNVWVYQTDNDQQLTADYVLPLKNNAALELGYMGSFMKNDILFYNELYDKGLGMFLMDSLTSSHFLYKENVHAFYAMFRKSYNKFSFSAGLRAEQAYRNSNLLTIDSVVKYNYFQLYPTIHLAYKVRNGELQLNYSKRVNRPEGGELNPFPEYIDPLNLSAGNPFLQPEYIHSLELGYQIKAGKYSIVPSIYYRYKYNGFTSVIRQVNDSVLLRTEENLSSDQSAGLEVIFSARPSRFFNANVSTNIFYNTINAENLGFSAKKSILSMNTSANLNFSFTKTTMLQASMNYRSKRQTPQGVIYPQFVINFGARQDLLKSKLSVTATLSDAFRTLRQKNILSSYDLYQTSINTRDARVFYLGLSYRFGVTQKKKEEKIQYDDNL